MPRTAREIGQDICSVPGSYLATLIAHLDNGDPPLQFQSADVFLMKTLKIHEDAPAMGPL